MRMLTADEHETLLRWRRSEWIYTEFPLPITEALVHAGRARLCTPRNPQAKFGVEETEWGERALRIDALIRQWGYKT